MVPLIGLPPATGGRPTLTLIDGPCHDLRAEAQVRSRSSNGAPDHLERRCYPADRDVGALSTLDRRAGKPPARPGLRAVGEEPAPCPAVSMPSETSTAARRPLAF